MASYPDTMAGPGTGSTDVGAYSNVESAISLPAAAPVLPDAVEMGQKRSTSAELLAVFRKLSWYLLPIFFLLNMLNYLDRTNLAFASIQMSQDLDLTTSQYGIGAGLFFVGYSTFQIPSQMILRVVGAPIWLSIIVTTWGITASCMAAVKNEISFYFVRLVLGFAEAGSFPGHWYYLTRFYPDEHITIPFSITDSAIMIAQVVGAPIAAGLLHLDGSADLRGWQWLFLVEGMPTTILGLLLSILLPPSPRSARCLTPTEAETVEKELTACRSIEGSSQQINSAFVQLNSALMNWPMYVLGLVKFGKDFTSYGCMFWAPMLIRGLLHKHQENGDGCTAWESPENDSPETGYKEVLLTAIPYSLAAVSSILVAWNSQRTGDRKWHISMSYALGAMMLVALPAASDHSILAGFIVLTLVIVFSLCANGTLLALASADGEGPALPLNLAVFNSVGNSSGLFGPWLLGEVVGRTCSYNLAFYIMGGFLAAAGVLVHLSEDKAGSKAAAVHTSKSYVELPQQPYIARMGGNREDATLDSATSDPMPALDEV